MTCKGRRGVTDICVRHFPVSHHRDDCAYLLTVAAVKVNYFAWIQSLFAISYSKPYGFHIENGACFFIISRCILFGFAMHHLTASLCVLAAQSCVH